MRALHRVVAALLLTGAAVLALPAGPAPAEPPDAAGWWWEAQVTSLLPTPPPPTVPEGGLYVAGDPTGPFGVSALRFLVPAGSVLGPVTLRVASAQGVPAVRACPTDITWQPEQGGPMSSAPPYDCERGAVPGTYDEPSKTVSFEISPLVDQGLLNVVLEPTPGSVFQVAFEKPGADAITVMAVPSTDPGGGSMPPPDLSYFDAPAFTDTGTAAPTFGGDGSTLPPTAESPDAPTTPTTVAAKPRPRVLPRTQLARKATRDPDRVAAAVVLLALTAAYIWLVHMPDRTPRRVGPLRVIGAGAQDVAHATAPAVGRGVGRFRRPRNGPTPRL